MQQEILQALSREYPITAQTVKASMVADISQKDLLPVLAGMVDAGLIIQQGKKYLLA